MADYQYQTNTFRTLANYNKGNLKQRRFIVGASSFEHQFDSSNSLFSSMPPEIDAKVNPAEISPTNHAARIASNLPAPIVYDAGDMLTRSRDEWVLSNGLGGFSMGTPSGIPERRYHAMLIAATTPPVGRIAAVQSFVEWLVVEQGGVVTRHDVSAMRFANGSLSPTGAPTPERFTFGQSCLWQSRVKTPRGDFSVERELVLHYGRNAVTVRYRVTRERASAQAATNARAPLLVVPSGKPAPTRIWLEARPLVSLRDFHGMLTPGEPHSHIISNIGSDGVTVVRNGVTLEMRIDASAGRFSTSHETWRNVAYTREHERGMDHIEDLLSPGVFVLPLFDEREEGMWNNAESMTTPWRAVVCEVPTPTPMTPVPEADDELTAQRARLDTIVANTLSNAGPKATSRDRDALATLAVAADRFVVQRFVAALPPDAGATVLDRASGTSTSMATIIAGYPWFADWGRDTCIAMPGLMMRCGRFTEARQSLAAFAAYRRRGLVPCTFDDGSGTPQYNTVDASLWFVHAACDYLRTTGDRAGFEASMRAACLEIVEFYHKGTDYSIRVDLADGLVMEGNEQTQLTWMDAKRDGVVFTPRYGKPVEISALWYSVLLELAAAIEPTTPKAARELHQWADQAGRSFAHAYWNSARGCLYDGLTPTPSGSWLPVAEIRPNQVFALALPHSPLTQSQKESTLRVITESLLTREGLRTLDAKDSGYRPRYEGVLFERDRAYHNGTVWPWLIGPYVDAVLRVGNFSAAAYAKGREAIAGLIEELERSRAVPGPVGSLAEVYDADALPDGTRRPEGCLAQAWSVAELIRAIVTLSNEGEKK